jgi:predicted amidohydrolase YtcJ
MGALADFGQFVAFAALQLVVSVLQLLLSPLVFWVDRAAARKRTRFTSVFITGGSNGLGAALAEAYAAPGVSIAITGRSEQRLQEVQRKCEAKGATVRVHTHTHTRTHIAHKA